MGNTTAFLRRGNKAMKIPLSLRQTSLWTIGGLAMLAIGGTGNAQDSFEVRLTGHGQVNVKPDLIGSRFYAKVTCVPTEAKANEVINDLAKSIKSELTESGDFDVETTIGRLYSSNRIQARRTETRQTGDFELVDVCAGDSDKVVDPDTIVGSDGQITKDQLGQVWTAKVDFEVKAPSAEVRALQEALKEIEEVEFASDLPRPLAFELSVGRSRTPLTFPALSEDLRETQQNLAQDKADQQAKNLYDAFLALGFTKTPDSILVAQREEGQVFPLVGPPHGRCTISPTTSNCN